MEKVSETIQKNSQAARLFELLKQQVFDCAMEVQYHNEGLSDDLIAAKLLDILGRMDQELRVS